MYTLVKCQELVFDHYHLLEQFQSIYYDSSNKIFNIAQRYLLFSIFVAIPGVKIKVHYPKQSIFSKVHSYTVGLQK